MKIFPLELAMLPPCGHRLLHHKTIFSESSSFGHFIWLDEHQAEKEGGEKVRRPYFVNTKKDYFFSLRLPASTFGTLSRHMGEQKQTFYDAINVPSGWRRLFFNKTLLAYLANYALIQKSWHLNCRNVFIWSILVSTPQRTMWKFDLLCGKQKFISSFQRTL